MTDMSRIIAITNQKGGVGKTTTAINLSANLAESGKFVLLVDMDPQGNATSGLGVDHNEIEKGIYDVLARNVPLRDVVVNTNHEGLRLAPATNLLAAAAVELVNEEGREYKLTQALDEVKGMYDYIIIDCPPSLGLLTVNALTAAEEILIPIQSEYYALEGLGQLLNTLHLVKDNLRHDLKILGAVITMFDKRNKLSGQVQAEVQQHFPYRVFQTVIPRNVRLTEAPSYGQSIVHYDKSSSGATAYRSLAEEILNLEDNF